MNEQERAEQLARAIDELLNGARRDEPPAETADEAAGAVPPELDDEELRALLEVARARADAAEAMAAAGLQYEGEVWRRVLERLTPVVGAEPSPADAAGAAAPAGAEDEMRNLEDIARLRREMAQAMHQFAEAHRDAVWSEVQSRITQAGPQRYGIFRLFGRKAAHEAGEPGSALEALATGQTVWSAPDSRVNELVQLARDRRRRGRRAPAHPGAAIDLALRRIERIAHDVLAGSGERGSRSGASRRPALGLVAAAAAIALLLAPVPLTGFAGHPAVEAAEYLAERAGVRESGPPPAGPVTDAETGTPMTAAGAAERLGVPVRDVPAPPGYTLASSLFFETPLTTPAGAFVQTFTSGGETVLVLQEPAGGDSLSAAHGATSAVQLPDGTPATLVSGAWTPSGDGFAWDEAASQSLVFETGGVRVTVQRLVSPGTPPSDGLATLLQFAAAFQ